MSKSKYLFRVFLYFSILSSNINWYYQNFTLFSLKLFSGSETIPSRSMTRIRSLPHGPIWVIGLPEVRKFQQHDDWYFSLTMQHQLQVLNVMQILVEQLMHCIRNMIKGIRHKFSINNIKQCSHRRSAANAPIENSQGWYNFNWNVYRYFS